MHVLPDVTLYSLPAHWFQDGICKCFHSFLQEGCFACMFCLYWGSVSINISILAIVIGSKEKLELKLT